MFDWINKDVSGYAQGPQQNGEAGVPLSGVNWSQLLGMIGHKQPAPFAPLSQTNMQPTYGGQQQPVAQQPLQFSISNQKNNGQDINDVNQIMKIIGAMYGVGG